MLELTEKYIKMVNGTLFHVFKKLKWGHGK